MNPVLQSRPPGAIPGCNAWWHHDDLAAIYPDGALVPTWPDRFQAYPLTQATVANQPNFYQNGIAGPAVSNRARHSYASMPGSNPTFSNAAYVADKRALSAFMVVETRSCFRTSYFFNIGGLAFVIENTSGVLTVFNSGAKATTLVIPNDRPFCIIVVAGGSGVDIYMDSVLNVQSVSLNTSGLVSNVDISGPGNLFGRLYEAALFSRTLSLVEINDLMQYSRAAYSTGLSSTIDNQIAGRVIFDGDSVTEGFGSTRNLSWAQQLAVNRAWLSHNYAVVGQTTTNIAAHQSTTFTFANATNWLMCLQGFNDLAGSSGATIHTAVSNYFNAAITAGFSQANLVAFTLSTTNQGLGGTSRDDFNTLIRANFTSYAGFLVDVAADTNLGVSGTIFNDATNFFDGVHPNDKGALLYAQLVRSTIGTSIAF